MSLSTTAALKTETFINFASFHYFRMVKKTDSNDEKPRKAINQIARSLEEILQQVEQANVKLDHLIETYGKGRYAYRYNEPYDLFSETYEE